MGTQSRNLFFGAIIGAVAVGTAAPADHLLLSEVGVATYLNGEGASSDYVEIFNPTSAPVSLDNYYLADTNLYTSVTITSSIDTGADDNIVRFPAGATLAPGQVAVVTESATAFIQEFFERDPANFQSLLGAPLLFETTETTTTFANMTSLNTGGANEARRTNFDLKDQVEFMILFHWNGVTPLVQDVDLVAWNGGGDPSDRFTLKGPGTTGTGGTPYLPDAGPMTYLPVGAGYTMAERTSTNEQFETTTGGNGVSGHDETSERTMNSWRPLDHFDAYPGDAFLSVVGGNVRPDIQSLDRNLAFPGSSNSINLSAVIRDNDGSVTSVTMLVNSGAGFIPVPATLAATNTYSATVGPFPDDTLVRYYVQARDNAGALAQWPINGPMDARSFLVDNTPLTSSDVVINEILYDNVGTDAYEFVELYNTLPTPVKMSRFQFAGDTRAPYHLPAQAEIAGNGYMVLTMDPDALRAKYTIPANVPVLQWNFWTLGNTQRLMLVHPNNYYHNRNTVVWQDIQYFRASPWPIPNVTVSDQTLELKSPTLDNRVGSNWALSTNTGTPGLPNSVTSSVADWNLY